MADNLAQLKELQAGMNAAFESLFKSAEEIPSNGKAIAAAKGQLAATAQMTFGAVLGPAFSVINLTTQVLAYMAVRVAIDLKLFEIISKPTSLDEIVQKTAADPLILQRILRAVGSIGYVKQTALAHWEPTPLTQMANVPGLRDWLIAHFDERIVCAGKFPEWLRKRAFKNTGAADDTVLTEVLGDTVWTYYEKHPEASAIFDSAISIQDNFPETMVPPYPFSGGMSEIGSEPGMVTLVDIGGGFGQAIKSLRQKYPALKGRFVLQDLPKTIKQIDAAKAKEDGFEPMEHDFFTEQPIKGAKYYHLRRVLHDWNDGPSLKILEATRSAMKETPGYSRLLIHEFVLPDVGAGFSESMVDLMMMYTVDGMERTESQWHELLKQAGFKIINILRPDEGTTSVIEAIVI
ncbi:S-adenosyl-L-methionine-dependent methyltransferase [Hyaloscypha variabilis]